MRGERFIQYAAALAIVALWGVLQIIDARSETYSAPQGVTFLCFIAAAFLFGFDKVAGLLAAWRRTNGTPPPSPPDKEVKPGE